MSEHVEIDRFTEDQLRILRSELLPEATSDGEFELFVQQCYRTRLDPFARQIQGTPGYSRGKFKLTVVVTIDGFRAIADRSGEYDGQTPQEWCAEDGVWREVWLDSDPPAAARCGVYRRGSAHPVYAVLTWDESPGPGSKSPLWKKGGMRAHMLSKCAEALALRKAFPNQLGGLYTTDELPPEVGDGSTASGGGLVAPPAPPPEDPPPPAAEAVVTAEQRKALLAEFDPIRDPETDEAPGDVRAEFVELFGRPDEVRAAMFDRAVEWIRDRVREITVVSDAELEGTSKAVPYTKADLMAFKPDGLESDEFMDLVLERAREMTPNAKPEEVIRSWRGLQQKPVLVREIVDQIEAGTFLAELPEPF